MSSAPSAAPLSSGKPDAHAVEALPLPPPRVRGLVLAALLVLGGIGLAIILAQSFNVEIGGVLPLLANRYYYVLIGLFLAAAFLLQPASPRHRQVTAFDWICAALSLASCAYLAVEAETIITSGWDVVAPSSAVAVCAVVVALALEAVRRTGGLALLAICVAFAAYPLFAGYMPGFLWGTELTLSETLAAHVMGAESVIGMPLRVVADTLVGFIIFGSVLSVMGGGQFFMDLSMALMGRSRGGPAKVAVLSSALFGSLSGSVVSNVLTTGRLTIPAMQRAGYPATYAGAIEACASTGGTLMPPVMGAVAFIMASFLDTSYTTIIIAAVVPSMLYYLALFIQADAFAARTGIRGVGRDQLPNLLATVRGGWHHLVSLVSLVVLLFIASPGHAAYYATAIMLVLGVVATRRVLPLATVRALLLDVTSNIAYLVATLCGIGLIVGSLAMTGVGSAFSRELILYGGNNVLLLLILGALTSFVLGMGMTVSACYIFLATVLAPALVGLGLNPLGAHLFVLYWGMLSYITPPVALAAIAAAQIAGGKGLETGFAAMRLGLVLFILPFMFVYNPGLLLQGDVVNIVVSVTTAIIATVLLACAVEGYLYRVGPIGRMERVALLAGALLVMVPNRDSELLGAGLLAVLMGAMVVRRRWARVPAEVPQDV